MTVIGIDLGTTYSAVAHVNASGEAEVIANAEGVLTTPSAVYFDAQGSAIVGQQAKEYAAVDAENTVTHIKRRMGERFDICVRGNVVGPEGVSALILRGLVDAAKRTLGGTGDVKAVITVPAYFGVSEREATAQAAEIAGIDVLELIAEPVAAAVAYGIDKGGTGTVLVYDLGGGTFDTTVISLTSSGPRVLVTDGDHELGGADWDERILAHLIDRFCALNGIDDPPEDESWLQDLSLRAEQLKKSLTAVTSKPIVIRHEDASAKVEVTRDEVEVATRDLLDRTFDIVDRALAAARAAGASTPTKALLVGGSSRMPAVARELTMRYGMETVLADPDLAVAKGAALHAHALAGRMTRIAGGPLSQKAQRGLMLAQVSSVLPRGLGILILDSFDPSGTRRIVDHIVTANTPLPVRPVAKRFSTCLDNQEKIRIEVYEQAGATASPEVEHNRRVLDGELSGLPSLKGGSPIDVEIGVDRDGRITVTATEPKSRRQLVLESYIEGVADSAEASRQADVVGRITILHG
ncbi:Hsp70 family protein [Mycobacterium sp. NPDC050041]|uniref:Hsp70 family protein n=1 Tax=Mycobacterium sp. NPDC050041 TaxID=3364293 RepID=UPI003C2EE2D7